MYTKKITADEFLELVINKELEIANAPFDYKYLITEEGQKEHPNWFQEYSFKTLSEFFEWKDFFFEHFYDWKPKSYSNKQIEREFNWCNLNWGLRCDFPLKLLIN